ncbi:hypothetical protein KR044_001206, partial [Drosophila immigrans]
NLKDAVTIKLTNAVCKNLNKSWVIIYECRLRAVSRNKTTFNFNASYIYPVNDVVQEISVFKKANGYKPWIFKCSVIDFCQYLKKPYHPFGLIINKFFKEFSNINHSCPYVGPLIIKDFYPAPNFLRLPFPTGEYLIKINWLLHKRLQYITDIYFTFTEDYMDM